MHVHNPTTGVQYSPAQAFVCVCEGGGVRYPSCLLVVSLQQLLLPLSTSGNYCSISKSQRGSRSAASSPGGLASSLTFSRFSEIVPGGEVTLRRILSEASAEDVKKKKKEVIYSTL